MSEQDDRLDAASRHADPTLSWDAMREQGMPMDQLMGYLEDDKDPCECCGLDAKHEEHAVRLETMDRLMVYLFSDGRPEAWEMVARRAYAVAKSFFPHLLMTKTPDGGTVAVSLERMGIIFDDPNTQAARAKWSARVQRMVTDPIHKTGSKAKAGFQKGEQACAKMSLAAKGNSNRNGGKRGA
jgi:hypothetical protein